MIIAYRMEQDIKTIYGLVIGQFYQGIQMYQLLHQYYQIFNVISTDALMNIQNITLIAL